MKILMVCLGNICRSPMAEGIMKKLIAQHQLDWQVASAGTNRYHSGEPPHPFSQKVCKTHGIDISKQRARDFVKEDALEYDLILAMASDVQQDIEQIIKPLKQYNAQIKLLLDYLPEQADKNVPDPWYGTEIGYTPVFKLIESACKALVLAYK